MIYSVSSELYLEVAARLAEAVGGGSYFSGSLTFPFGDTEGDRDVIADLVPVWWEFHTTGDGGEVLNDFSFSDLRACL